MGCCVFHESARYFLTQYIKESINSDPDMENWPAKDKADYSFHVQSALNVIGMTVQRSMARSLLRHIAASASFPPWCQWGATRRRCERWQGQLGSLQYHKPPKPKLEQR